MSTSTVPAVLTALRTALAIYAGLTSVSVWTSWPGEMTGENIVLCSGESMEVEDRPLGIGEDDRDENYTIAGVIWVSYPDGTETEITACRDRAYAIYGCIESYINDTIPQTISTTCRNAEMTGHRLAQGIYAGSDFNGRWAQIDFSIDVEAQKQP